MPGHWRAADAATGGEQPPCLRKRLLYGALEHRRIAIFSDGSDGTATDSTANNNDGTLNGSPTWQTSTAPIGNLTTHTNDPVALWGGQIDSASDGQTLVALLLALGGLAASVTLASGGLVLARRR